jgi:hypothetical protein
VLRWLAVGSAMLVCRSVPATGQQQLLTPEPHWTDIGISGRTAVNWDTLEQQEVNGGGPLFLIWAHTQERRRPVLIRVAVHCRPGHAAVVEAQRTRDDGSVEIAGPVPLTDLVWQDPPPRSYLADIESAVCARMRDAQVRPC